MNAHWGLDYLSNWQLKITPPADFNDPFELKSPAPEVFTSEYFEKTFNSSADGIVIEALAESFVTKFPSMPQALSIPLATAFLAGPNSSAFKQFEKKLRKHMGLSVKALRAQSALTHAALPAALENARRMTHAARPQANAEFERGISEKVPAMLGVLCLSKNHNQPLMWSHYAESHRGLMIEFDSSHASFNRRRSDKDEFGFLRDVRYVERRPALNIDAISQDRGFEVFALTKSNHWAYEEEQRFIWPLEQCEKTPNGQVCLIAIPPAAVVSVTLGCKASDDTESELLRSISGQAECSHIKVRRAKMHATEFELVYEELGHRTFSASLPL
ncbi:DUF2971 domain-containing protein [Hydrogenophaga borbori]